MTHNFNNRGNGVKDILLEALEIEDSQRRQAFLEQACHGDAATRREVEDLIQAAEAAGAFLPREPATQGVFKQGIDAGAVKATIKLDLADALDEAVGQTLGRYKLLERVGEGGCGVVYVAEQTEPVRRRVALKVINIGSHE